MLDSPVERTPREAYAYQIADSSPQSLIESKYKLSGYHEGSQVLLDLSISPHYMYVHVIFMLCLRERLFVEITCLFLI